MIIKYKNYIGAIIYMQQIQGRKYRIAILDNNDVRIDFTCSLYDIELVNCVANNFILDKLNLK